MTTTAEHDLLRAIVNAISGTLRPADAAVLRSLLAAVEAQPQHDSADPPQRPHGAHPDIGCTGIVNGMHEPDPAGAYVKIVAVWPDGQKDVMVVSRGAAYQLADEIWGAVGRP